MLTLPANDLTIILASLQSGEISKSEAYALLKLSPDRHDRKYLRVLLDAAAEQKETSDAGVL